MRPAVSRSLAESPRGLWSIRRTVILCIAAAFFLRFWPLQMHHWLGEAYMNQGMLVKNRIERCVARGWGSWPAPDEYKGQTIDELYESVYAEFDKSIRFYPFYMETYYIVGRYYIDGGGYSIEKANEIEKRLRRPPAEDEVITEQEEMLLHQRLAALLEDGAERLHEGRRVLLRDIYMNPNYKWAHNNLGVIYDKLAEVALDQGDFHLAPIYRDFARRHYEIALDIDPDQIFALFNLGNGYMREGLKRHQAGDVKGASPYLSKASDFLERCLEVQPGKVESYQLLSQIRLIQKDYCFYLARASVMAGRLDEARDSIATGLEDENQRDRMYRLVTSDRALDVITSSPWFEQLCTSLGLEPPSGATGEAPLPLQPSRPTREPAE